MYDYFIIGGFLSGGFCHNGSFCRGRGLLSGGFCPRGFCPAYIYFMYIVAVIFIYGENRNIRTRTLICRNLLTIVIGVLHWVRMTKIRNRITTSVYERNNKGFDGINVGNILHHKSVKYKIPPYFKDLCLYHSYSNNNIYLQTRVPLSQYWRFQILV